MRPPTPAQLALLQDLANGRQFEEIAYARGWSLYSVQSQFRDLYAKLGARNRAHAIAIAMREGLIR